MKTEEILRYESEFKAMQEALGTSLLVFDFPTIRPLVNDEDGHTHEREGMGYNCIAKEPKDKNFT